MATTAATKMQKKRPTLDDVWAMFQESDRKMEQRYAETDRLIKENIESQKKLGELIGGISNNNGSFAEEYFANALTGKMEFAGQKYDALETNLKAKAGGVQDEFDVVLYNGNSVAIIEVKYKAQPRDVEKMVTKKVPNFRTLFPYYKDYKIYLGIGSMSFYDDVIEKAKELGIGLLKQVGEIVEADTSYVKAY